MSFIRKIKRKGRVYLAEVENRRIDGRVKQYVIQYLGKDSNAEESIFPSNPVSQQPSDIKIYGSVMALNSIARKIGIYDLLGEHASAILTLVFCHCHDYRSISDTEKWFKQTDLANIFGEDITEKQLRNALEYLDALDHFQLQKSIFEMACEICEEKPTSVIYDVTNIHFEGIHCKLAKKGKDKQNVRGRRLIQIGLVITKKSGLPIFHQVHPGNIHDSKIFKEAIVLLRRFGIRSGVLVHDRGITSKSSILDLVNSRWKVVAGVALHAGIKSAISNLDLILTRSFRNLIRQGKTHFYGTTVPFEMGRVKGKLIVLINRYKREAIQKKRLDRILDAQDSLQKGKDIDPSLKKYFSKLYKINTHALDREEKYDGISVLFTNGKISKQESVKLYFDKDLIEKSFQALRGIINIRPVHVRLNGKVNAHILICYLSYLLLTTFRCFLKKYERKTYVFECSTLEALEEISRVYKIYYKSDASNDNLKSKKSKKYQLVEMSELQADIMKAVCPEVRLQS